MKKKCLIFPFILIIICWGCKSDEIDILHKGIDKRQESKIEIEWDSLVLDIFYTSGQGNFFMRDSVISFADRYYTKLYNYDCKTGSLLSSKFGLGHGTNEMMRYISAHPVINDTVIMFIDGNGIITLCGTNSYKLNKNKKGMDFEWVNKYSANYDSPEIYGFQYEPNIYNYQGKYIIPVSPLWHRMNKNGFIPSDMYKKSHILGLLDINTMKVSDLFGNFPPVYSGKSIPQYSNFSYTFHQDTIYTSFAADPLIHVYKYPDKYLYSFGYECTGIDRSYTVTDSFLDNEVYKDYERCGSNQEFFYFPDLGLFFRKYWTGIKLNKSGLQIYDREYNLIGDIIVPETFQLLGYYTPYFYGVSAIPIETENETWITFYKLNINFLD